MKESFANTINTTGSTANLSTSACERYGMTWGCDGNCPVFLDGKCKEPQECINDILHTDRFDNLKITEIVSIYPQLAAELIEHFKEK